MLNIIGRGKGAKLRIIPASGKGLGASSNIANPVPASTGWTEISPGVWQCDGVTVGAATTLILAQEADGLVIGQAYLLSATITGTADILIRSGSTTLDANWDGSPKIFIPGNGNFNIFQRAGGYTIQSIVIREAVIIAAGVTSASETGLAIAVSQDAVPALGVESASEVGLAPMAGVAALGIESASEVGSAAVASMEAPAATGVQSASEVAIVPADTTAPTMGGDTYTEGTFTFAATISEPATMHYLVSVTEPTTVDDIVSGTGLFKTTVEVTVGVNNNYLELSGVPAGTHWFAALPVDAFNNADFAEAHVAQYAFPGGYVATGVESVSEVGTPAAPDVIPTATGVESTSEVGLPTVIILAPATTGVESASEVGSAVAASVNAPAATEVESASEIGAAVIASVDAPVATGVQSASEIGTATPPDTAAFVTDDFNRANSNGLGPAWTDIRDQWDIVSVQASQPTSSVSTTSVYTGTSFAADQYCQATVAGVMTAGGIGLVLRLVDANNFIYCYNINGSWRVYKKVAGSDTQIGSTSTASLSASDIMYFEVSGNTVTLKKGGSGGTTLVTGSTGGDLAATGSPGLNCYASGSGQWYLDDFEAGDL